MKTITMEPESKAWVQTWDNEVYEDLNEYVDELWDSVIDLEADCGV